MIDTKQTAINLLAALEGQPELIRIAMIENALDRAFATGFADGFNERDSEIPTGDNP